MATYSLGISRWFYLGVPAASGTLEVYQASTTTPVTIYTDAALTTPASNPLTLDSNGEALFYVGTTYALRLIAKTVGGITIRDTVAYPVPNMTGFTGSGTDMNKIAGITNGTAQANKALVTDTNSNVGGVNTETFATASTRLANMAAVQGSMAGGHVNRLRNGQMDVWQRGTSVTISSGTPGYTADGWIVSTTGAAATITRVVVGNPSYYGLQIAGNASMSATTLSQRVESSLCAALISRVCTIQASIYNGTGSSISPTLTVRYANAADNWASSTTIVGGAGLQACPTGATTRVAYTFNAGNSATNGLEIVLDFGGALNVNTKLVIVTDLDLRASPGVTTGQNDAPPKTEARAPGEEFNLCQRYYQSSYDNGVAPGTVTSAGALSYWSSATSIRMAYPYKASMRSTPTLTSYSTATGASGKVYDATGAADITVLVGSASQNNCYVYSNGGAVASREYLGQWTLSAEL